MQLQLFETVSDHYSQGSCGKPLRPVIRVVHKDPNARPAVKRIKIEKINGPHSFTARGIHHHPELFGFVDILAGVLDV